MKTKLIAVFCIILVVLFLWSLCAVGQDMKGKVPKDRVPDKAMKMRVPDPAADIQIVVLSKESEFKGRIRIIGIVKNVGFADYISKPNQQAANLYAMDVTCNNVTNALGQLDFPNLKAGQEMRITYDTGWETSQEFPACYKLVITYDPDIAADGNANNDDRNGTNNEKKLTGYDIRQLFKNQNPIQMKGKSTLK